MSHYLDITRSNFISKYKLIKHDSNVDQSGVSTTTWTDMTGSSISYTPESDSSYVIYEYTFHLGRKGSNNNIYMETNFVYSTDGGSNWTNYDNNSRIIIGSTGTILKRRGVHVLRLCIDTWGSSERLFKMQCRRVNSTNDFLLHKLTEHFSAGDSLTSYFRPIVSCYSITQ